MTSEQTEKDNNMNIDEQLENFLADLGVKMDRPEPAPHNDSSIPEVSIFQASRDHYGVFYRLDIIDQVPQLRIIVPIEHGALKMEIYLVRMNDHIGLNTWFSTLTSYEGSPAFERGRDANMQHLLYAVAEMIKQLFWSGDLDTMSFPPEIAVCRLV
ncbi:MAG: hypothetical protein M3Z08_18545 [Chloroflexota bacterium]|nr:hypothetical protein [Chloroflexota bacterium]